MFEFLYSLSTANGQRVAAMVERDVEVWCRDSEEELIEEVDIPSRVLSHVTGRSTQAICSRSFLLDILYLLFSIDSDVRL